LVPVGDFLDKREKHFVFGTRIYPNNMDGVQFFNHRYFFLFFGKLIPPQVDKSTGVHPEIPIDDGHPPPPTALVRQLSATSAAPPKKVPSLKHCFLSDGCFDVQKFLQCQVDSCECSLWRTSTALNLIHGVGDGESLSVGKKAHAAVAPKLT
jgi:hypothetical protein